MLVKPETLVNEDLLPLTEYERGYLQCMWQLAVWKDGEQLVGVMQTPLRRAASDFLAMWRAKPVGAEEYVHLSSYMRKSEAAELLRERLPDVIESLLQRFKDKPIEELGIALDAIERQIEGMPDNYFASGPLESPPGTKERRIGGPSSKGVPRRGNKDKS